MSDALAPSSLGVDPAAPPADLPKQLASLEGLGAQLLVVPLAHPRYRRDHRRPRDEPATRSDLLLHSGQWGKHVVGKVSPWLQLDSPHAAVRRRSEAAFRQEIAWAAHLGLSGVLLPPPAPECANYARLLEWAALSTQHLQFLVRVPAGAASDASSPPSTTYGPWACWDRLRSLCEQSASLGVALELGLELPAAPDEMERWCGEPVRLLLLPTGSFLSNKKGYPTLSRAHQAAFSQVLRLRPKVVVCGREAAAGAPEGQTLGAHLQYLRYLSSKIAPMDETAKFESP